jgi:PAS domain-containing protein
MIEVDDLASEPGEITAAQWRQIVNGATDTAIISTDERTSWNTGACRILGWSEPEMLGKSLSRIFAGAVGAGNGKRAHTWQGRRRGRMACPQGRKPLLGSRRTEPHPRGRKGRRIRQDLARSHGPAGERGNDPRRAACARGA